MRRPLSPRVLRAAAPALILAILGLVPGAACGAGITPIPQRFLQESATRVGADAGLPAQGIQLLDLQADGAPMVFAEGRWHELADARWRIADDLTPRSDREFVLRDPAGAPATVGLPWRDVIQVLRRDGKVWLATAADPMSLVQGQARSLGWPSRFRVRQIALSAGALHVASDAGLFQQLSNGWQRVAVSDGAGRSWATEGVLGVAFDAQDRLWFATKAGVGCRTAAGWQFYEGKDGLPWNDFTGIAAGADGAVWFGTRLGAVRFEDGQWHYRQGPRWLPHDDVRQIVADARGTVWLATAGGLGRIERAPMTLAAKADHYEDEIARFIKRTPYGYVAEARLRTPADRRSADPQDSDNDGLWTAMYGAGECFAYAATRDPNARQRATKAFEALRFLQTVTQGGPHAPPKGFVARTVRPRDWPDPNVGGLERDREAQKSDRLWKVYEPRWPLSADGQWYWKSDTSSDELDGHYFFYPLYCDLCAETDAEKARVREVVRDLTDHLIAHGFALMDHDGRPTRWAVFGPQFLNRDPMWWPERGLNSLSILSYLAVAAHVTGDDKYTAAARELVERHGYAQNLMNAKVQHGPGSGNQSDDEMAFMCFYNLLRYSNDDALKAQVRFSFYRAWANEAPEMNPFFNFAYAAHNLDATIANPWGQYPIGPWPGWLDDARTTLVGFPLDRLNWTHRNSHRLDIQPLDRQAAADLHEPDPGRRGRRVNGKVIPVENRYFTHWNTDPWALDCGGQGEELGAGTVFLLPYYMGLYHGFVEKPAPAR
jgi:hypothetical protein